MREIIAPLPDLTDVDIEVVKESLRAAKLKPDNPDIMTAEDYRNWRIQEGLSKPQKHSILFLLIKYIYFIPLKTLKGLGRKLQKQLSGKGE